MARAFGGNASSTRQPARDKYRSSSLPQLLAQHVFHIANLFSKQIQLARQSLNLKLGSSVDGVIKLAAQTVLRVLAVLAHHDDRRLHRSQHRQKQIEQDKRIRIPRFLTQHGVDGHIDGEREKEREDEGPRPAKARDLIGDALAERRILVNHFIGMTARPQPHELLRSMKLPPQHPQHVHPGERLAPQEHGNVFLGYFDAHHVVEGHRVGLMRSLFQHRGEPEELSVGRFVDHHFLGPGLHNLPLADRATIANMGPEYGATCGIFPVDEETLRYLRLSGRTEEHIAIVEAYFKEQGLFHTADTPEAEYTDVLDFDQI